MKTPQRMMIFSPEARKMETLLLQNASFHVVEACEKETDVYFLLMQSMPDILILDDRFPGTDMPNLCRRISLSCAALPKVLLITQETENTDISLFDVLLSPSMFSEGFGQAMETLSLTLCPKLAEKNASLRIKNINALLNRLGISSSLKGKAYMEKALEVLSCLPNPHAFLGNRLYAHLAACFSSTPGAVEKALRTAIEATWLTGYLPAISALFGYSVDPEKGKPTNTEFLARLSLYIQAQTQKELQ